MQLTLPGLGAVEKKSPVAPPPAPKGHILKQDLVEQVAERLEGYLKKDVGQAVDIILDAMTEALTENRRVEIRGFGSFEVRQRQAKVSKNPKTEQIMNIPPRKTLHFTMSKSVKDPLIKK